MRFGLVIVLAALAAPRAPAQCGSALAGLLRGRPTVVVQNQIAPAVAAPVFAAPAAVCLEPPAVEYRYVPIQTTGAPKGVAPPVITDGPTRKGPAPAPQYTPEQLREEVEFLAAADSPKLFPMDKALEVARLTGKPILCWMGKHAFADPAVRQLSKQLGATTIQAAMDGDGTAYDEFNPRVKFDSSQYVNGGRTYTLSAGQFKFEGPDTPKERTTAYKIVTWFETKQFPGGTDPLTGKRQD